MVQTDNGGEGNGFGIGTGVVVNSDAEVLTALHVIQGATEIQLAFADGTRTSATATPSSVISAQVTNAVPGPGERHRGPDAGRASLRGTSSYPLPFGSSSAMRVGDEVFAVGNPLGLVGSLSAGVVSGFDRDFRPEGREEPLRGLIQFDAAVNPGNSGGPLLDRRGQVVGIVTGLINPTDLDFFIGIGFAVPIDVAVSAAGGPAQ